MKNRTAFMISLIAGMLLITSCTGSEGIGPTNTPDPLLMNFNERAIWDFENFRDEVNDLAAAAAATPAQDLEPIVKQMTALKEEIGGCEYPLSASQAHSALLSFASFTEQCYFGKYAEHLVEISGQGSMLNSDDHCDQVQIYEERLDTYLQELKGADAD